MLLVKKMNMPASFNAFSSRYKSAKSNRRVLYDICNSHYGVTSDQLTRQ